MSRAPVSRSEIEEAKIEILQTADETLEYQTAVKWAARALAGYECFLEQMPHADAAWLFDAEDHYHEAIEHAALVGDRGETVRRIQEQVVPVRRRAHVALDKSRK